MNADRRTETRSVVVERELPHPPEKVWRALTQPHLLEAWLMASDFEPVEGHAFRFRADWGEVDCEVLTIEQQRTLRYTWAAYGLESIVTWTLAPTSAGGTHLRMEQTGFRTDQEQAYRGAQAGWPAFFDALAQLLARGDDDTQARA
ncbi:SRPBCC domain-containing protein [Burkholderia multivorans]|uniref:SRPBCC family protein n=1 Tax=Burkholderia multivorans TaxID=87883 RepID=UPI000D00C896|nr:SRPBCC domain-containing protein [Burkholderia multivorans]MBU9630825.1 SRPBCC domain-containing protein [Burkholderia multivorans]PRE69741.1 polyketide cyclase [Burkholderia multivorans]PRF13551.1 polyketide cyclase [Burkholderia multivorans]